MSRSRRLDHRRDRPHRDHETTTCSGWSTAASTISPPAPTTADGRTISIGSDDGRRVRSSSLIRSRRARADTGGASPMSDAMLPGEARFWDLATPLLGRPGVTRSTMMGLPCLRWNGVFFALCDRRSGDLLVSSPRPASTISSPPNVPNHSRRRAAQSHPGGDRASRRRQADHEPTRRANRDATNNTQRQRGFSTRQIWRVPDWHLYG